MESRLLAILLFAILFEVYDCAKVRTFHPAAKGSKSITKRDQYVGCFKDDSDRDLPEFALDNNNKLTVELCTSTCKKAGYKFAGMQYGTQCFCGNSYGKYGKSSSCNMKCKGNSAQNCGGNWANNIYKTYNEDSLTDVYIGCFVDKPNRDLPEFAIDGSSTITIQMCIDTCTKSGYKYAGVQYSSQCFCGNSYGSYGKSDGGCNMKCNGNKAQTCGGTWANAVYRTKYHGKTIDDDFIGCFVDKANRDLPKFAIDGSSTITIQMCIDTCLNSGYKYAGVQFSSQCFCGNAYGSYGKSNACSMKCNGDKGQTCGGFWANSVYKTNFKGRTVDDDYIGCFADKANRDLEKFAVDGSSTLTIEFCIDTCSKSGYRYAGVQFASQCFCGNDYGSYGNSNGCSMKCNGNKAQTCGGWWANSVYHALKNKPAAPNYHGCSVEENTNRPNGDLPNMPIRGTKSASDCAKRCTENVNCVAFVQDVAGQNCWLKSSTTNAKAEQGVTTGTCRCSLEANSNHPWGDFKDAPIRKPDLQNPQDCAAICVGHARCMGYVFGADKACWLKQAITNGKRENGVTFGVCRGTTGDYAGCSVEQNVNRPGGDLPGMPIRNVAFAQDCAKMCHDRGNCKAYIFDAIGFNCWLKSGVTGAKAENGCVSGICR